jgi:hypothetical protein
VIALLAAAAVALSSDAVLTKYETVLKAVHEPRVFTVEYTLLQTGTRTLEQTHRIFRSGGDERDEIIAVNGTRTTRPQVRIFRGRRYRYTVSSLAPRPAAYDFTFVGTHRNGRHVDYVYDLTAKRPAAFTLTRVTIDGVTFLPGALAFVTRDHDGHGEIHFAKAEKWWVATSVSASASEPGGTAHERLTFTDWRFPSSLPAGTFGPRPPVASGVLPP